MSGWSWRRKRDLFHRGNREEYDHAEPEQAGGAAAPNGNRKRVGRKGVHCTHRLQVDALADQDGTCAKAGVAGGEGSAH